MSNLAEKTEMNETMTDEEIKAISRKIFKEKTCKYTEEEFENMKDEERLKLMEYMKYLPYTSTMINTFVKLNFATKEELEEENKKLIRERAWENAL